MSTTTFRIKVKPFKGQDYMVDVEPETTVLELKRRIVATGPMRDVDPSRLRLIVLGRVLADDSSTLASQHVTEGTVVHMIVRDPEVPQPAEQQAPRPQPSAEMPRSNSTPFEDGAIPPIPGGAFGGIDVGGLFRGIMQQVGTAAAVINAQRSAAAPAAPAAPPSEPAAAPAPPTAAATAPTPPLGGLPPGVAFQQVQLGPGLAHGMPPPPFLIPQPSPLAAVHVHLHVTLAELESVPEQVQRLQQRLAANAAPNITQIHIQTHNVNVDPATAAATAARNPNPATSRPQAPPSRPTLDSVARPTGELVGTSILTVLQKALETAGTPDAMMLMSGNWAVANRIRDPLRAYAATRTANQVGNAELREELVEEATIDAMVKLDGNADIQRELRARVRDGVDGRRLIQGVVRITLRDLLDLVLDGNSADIGPQVRRLAVKTVGLAMSYFERNVARNGASDLDAIVNATINAVMTEALRSRPDVAPLAGMFAPMLGGTMREWRHEYESSLRTPNDATRLEAAAAAVVPVSTRPAAATGNRPAPAAVAAAATTAAPPRASSDLDELLDACLDETAPAAAAPPAPTAAAPPSRLQRLFESSTALDPESRRSLAAMVAEDLRAGTAGLVPPPDHYFDAYRSNSLF